MNNRIATAFSQGPVFTAYLTAGDGGIEHTLASALALIEGGVKMLEVGIPFSDPVADGPVIQRAAARALQVNTSLDEILWLVGELRKRSDIPLILFSYFNPVLSCLNQNFFQQAKNSGLDGILIIDLPPEEADDYCARCVEVDLASIFVVTPATSSERMQKIANYSSGFIYYACRKGTTGLRSELPLGMAEKINTLKNITDLPVIVGFGISTEVAAAEVLKYADGFVVGSLFVKAIEEGANSDQLINLARSINPVAKEKVS